jgi:hypothetical protein
VTGPELAAVLLFTVGVVVWLTYLAVVFRRDEAEQRVLDERCRRRIEQRRMVDEACAVDAARVKDEER